MAVSLEDLEQQLLDVPNWVPGPVREKARKLWREISWRSALEAALVRRLTTDPRMKRVWSELGRKSRPTGDFLNLAKSGQPRSQAEQEAAMAILFGVAVEHGRSAVSDDVPESLAGTFVVGLHSLRCAGGEVFPKMFAFGAAATRQKAFVVSMVPIMRDLFGGPDGNPHVGTVTTLARVALDCRVPADSVREWCRLSRRKRAKS